MTAIQKMILVGGLEENWSFIKEEAIESGVWANPYG